jgi:protein PhnA
VPLRYGLVQSSHVNARASELSTAIHHNKLERQMTMASGSSVSLHIEVKPSETGCSMSGLPKCPKCNSEYTYEDGSIYVCPECSHEWEKDAVAESDDQKRIVRDAHGNVLQDGDAVTVIKDLRVKGSSLVVKVGTKVKNIRLVEGDHDIDCKIDGIGAMQLKSEFVKKA